MSKSVFITRPASRSFLIVSLFSLACFAIVAWQANGDHWLARLDHDLAVPCYEFTAARPLFWNIVVRVTNLGVAPIRTGVIIFVALMLLLQHQWFGTLIWISAQWTEREMVALAKEFFERTRPEYASLHGLAAGWSFPSGHTAGAMTTYGMLAFLLAGQIPRRGPRLLGISVCCLIAVGVGASRILLGVHWFSDVLAAYLLALAYICLWLALYDWLCQRQTGT